MMHDYIKIGNYEIQGVQKLTTYKKNINIYHYIYDFHLNILQYLLKKAIIFIDTLFLGFDHKDFILNIHLTERIYFHESFINYAKQNKLL